MPMMLITTSSSISVKPSRRLPLPVMIGNSVDGLARCERIHIEHVVTRLWIVGRTLVAAQAPGIGRGRRSIRIKRIARDAPQEIDAHLLLALLVLDSVHQHLQVW